MSVHESPSIANPILHRERVRAVLAHEILAPSPFKEPGFYRGLTPRDRSEALKWWSRSSDELVPDGLGPLVCDGCGHAHEDLSWSGEQRLVMCIGCWTGEFSTCDSKMYNHQTQSFMTPEQEARPQKPVIAKKMRSRPPRDRAKDRADILAGVARYGSVTAYANAVGVKPVTMHNRSQGAGLSFNKKNSAKPPISKPPSPPSAQMDQERATIILGAKQEGGLSAYARSMGVPRGQMAMRAHRLGIRRKHYQKDRTAESAAKALAAALVAVPKPQPARTDLVRTAVEITQALKSSVSADPKRLVRVGHGLLAVIGEGVSTAAPPVLSGMTFSERGMLIGGRRHALSDEARASVDFDDRMHEFYARDRKRKRRHAMGTGAAIAEGLD